MLCMHHHHGRRPVRIRHAVSVAALTLAIASVGVVTGSGEAAATAVTPDPGSISTTKMPCGQVRHWYNHCARSHVRLFIEDVFGNDKVICVGPGVTNLDNFGLPWTVVYAQVRGVC